MSDLALTVAGAGVDLPVAVSLAGLAGRLDCGRALGGTLRRFDAPHTDLPPLAAEVGECTGPASTAARQRGLPREARLAAAVAATALAEPSAGERVGTVWASSTAGLEQYGQICVDAATLDPGLVSPLTGPQAAYNGPASAVSLRLGLTGPQLTLTGSAEAGAAALVEAARLLAEEQCAEVLVGGSASLSRWRLAGAAMGRGPVPAEGAVCLRLVGPLGGGTTQRGDAVTVRPLRRARLSPTAGEEVSRFVKEATTAMRCPPVAVALSAANPAEVAAMGPALRSFALPWWHLERITGDLGAAGGLLAVVAAVAACGRARKAVRSVLVLALGGGQAVAVEALSHPPRRGL
jgi:hypothetical protein